jgi:hypothetical protein
MKMEAHHGREAGMASKALPSVPTTPRPQANLLSFHLEIIKVATF